MVQYAFYAWAKRDQWNQDGDYSSSWTLFVYKHMLRWHRTSHSNYLHKINGNKVERNMEASKLGDAEA